MAVRAPASGTRARPEVELSSPPAAPRGRDRAGHGTGPAAFVGLPPVSGVAATRARGSVPAAGSARSRPCRAWARIDPELLDERAPGRLVGVERLGLPAGSDRAPASAGAQALAQGCRRRAPRARRRGRRAARAPDRPRSCPRAPPGAAPRAARRAPGERLVAKSASGGPARGPTPRGRAPRRSRRRPPPGRGCGLADQASKRCRSSWPGPSSTT